MNAARGASLPKRRRVASPRGALPSGFEAQADLDLAMQIILRLIQATSPECAAVVAYAWVEGGSAGWIEAAVPQIEAKTGLRRDRQKTALEAAKDARLLGEWVGGVPRRRHLHVETEELLRLTQTTWKSQYAEKPQTSLQKNHKQGGGKPADKRGANQQTHPNQDLLDTIEDGSVDRSESAERPMNYGSDGLDARVMAIGDNDVGEDAIAIAGEISGRMRKAKMRVDLGLLAKLSQALCQQGRVDVLRLVMERMERPEVAANVRNPYAYLVASIEAEPPESELAGKVRQAAEAKGGKLSGHEHLERSADGQMQEHAAASVSVNEEAVRAMIADPESDAGRIARQVIAGRLAPSTLYECISVNQTGGYDAAHVYVAVADRALDDLVTKER